MSQKDFLDIVKENFGGRNVVKISKNDDYVLTLTFENKKNIIFSTHPLSVGICLSERSLPEKEIITILKENLCELILADCQKLKDEPIFKFVFKGFSERTLVFEGLKRCANILLLDEDSNVLWAFRTFKGEFRQGLPFEKWAPPPQKNLKEDFPLEKDFSEVYNFLLNKFKNLEKRKLNSKIETLSKKIEILKNELDEGQNFLNFEFIGKSLLAAKDIHKRGEEKNVVLDYSFSPPKEIFVDLDPKLTVYENAQKFFKLAKKGKERIKLLPKRIAETEKEINNLKEKIAFIDAIDSLEDLPKEEKPKEKSAKEKKIKAAFKDVIEIDLPLGYKGYAGKNARGNEIVSFKIANGEDFWFHASDYSGSHLIVRNPKKEEELPFEVEKFALKYAAQRSSAPKDNIVEVIQSKAKHLSKVKGKLGAVYVSKFKKRKIDLNKNE